MANIRLKELIEANIDPKLVARSKETGKLVYFKSPKNKAAAIKAGSHTDPKDKKDDEPKVDAKPNDMFGGDYAKDRGGDLPVGDLQYRLQKNKQASKADPMTSVIAVASRAQMVPKQVAGWADKNGVDLSKVSDALSSGELNVFDFMTAVNGLPGNDIAKGVIAKYSQSSDSKGVKYSQSVKQDTSVDGQDDEELYNALSDMGYDFGEFGSDDFDEDGFADAAMSLGYRYDDKNKVWNHRDTMGDKAPKSTPTPKMAGNWKPDEDGKMSFDAATDVQNHLNAVLGTDDGVAEVDYYGGSIDYHLSDGENSIFVGPHYDNSKLYAVSFQGPSMNIDKIEASYKTFKNPKDALTYAGELAKANRKGLEQKQESTKLTSMIKR
jgi:hypothetical protein